MTWVVLAAQGERAEEARASAEAFLEGVASVEVEILDHRESFLPHEASAVKEAFEGLKPVAPDLVFTHTRGDLHQDHRLACELTWNSFRDHVILEYEIPKYDGDLGAPNVFVPLTEEIVAERSGFSSITSRASAGATGSTRSCFVGCCGFAGWSR